MGVLCGAAEIAALFYLAPRLCLGLVIVAILITAFDQR